MKASAEIRQSKSTKTSQSQANSMGSEIQRRRLQKDVSVNKDNQKYMEPRPQSTTYSSLSHQWINQTQKGGDNRVYTIKSYQQTKSPPGAVYRDTEKSTGKSTEKLTSQILSTSQKPTGMQSTMQSTKKSTKSLLKLPVKSNYEVDRMVTDADFQRHLPRHPASTSQCYLPMTTSCKIYSTEHAEALHRAQTALVRLNLVSITILEKLTC